MTSHSPSIELPSPDARRRRWIHDIGPIGLLLATLGASCGAWHWAFDLASHFRWYYFVIGLWWLVGVCRQKRRLSQVCLGLSLVWNGGCCCPITCRSPNIEYPPTATQVSLISLNVYTANKNKAAVVDYLRRRQPDLIVVMEVDVDWAYALGELKDLYPHKLMQPRPDDLGSACCRSGH